MTEFVVTLATVTDVSGDILVDAGSFEEAIEKAIERASEAAWPVNQHGGTVEPIPGKAYATYVRNEETHDEEWPEYPATLDPFAAASALRAIRARIKGEFDHPDLIAFGPLSERDGDILAIIAKAGA